LAIIVEQTIAEADDADVTGALQSGKLLYQCKFIFGGAGFSQKSVEVVPVV
jgi:hypothetical protein